ncbi:MAG: hydrogenase maturation protease [Terracidiphilus sp.]
MTGPGVRCLILACGNTLRSDDGVGPKLAAWADERFRDHPHVQVISRQQWPPELSADIAAADSILFIDASVKSPPGRVSLVPVSSRVVDSTAPHSHHLSPNQLLGLTRSLYGSIKSHAMLLTIGVSSTELGESLSEKVEAALPRAQGILEKAVRRFLGN